MSLIAPITKDIYPSDNSANSAGYTLHLLFKHSSLDGDVALLIKPNSLINSYVEAFDTDNQEWVRVEGWRGTWSKPQ